MAAMSEVDTEAEARGQTPPLRISFLCAIATASGMQPKEAEQRCTDTSCGGAIGNWRRRFGEEGGA